MLSEKSFECVLTLTLFLAVTCSPVFAQKNVEIYPPGAGGLTVTPGTDIEVTSSAFVGTSAGDHIMVTFEGGSDFFIVPTTGDYSEGDLTLGANTDASVTFIFDNVGGALGENSSLNVPGVAITCCGPVQYKGFSIGLDGQGSLILQNGADAWIGIDAAERGGTGDTWTFPNEVLDFSTVGDSAGSNGSIILDGADTTFNMNGQLLVGAFGSIGGQPATGSVVVRNSALLNIEDGRAFQRGLAVGAGDNSVGTVTVSNGSTLLTDGGVSLAGGAGSSGTLNVTGTGTVANIVDGYSFVGQNPGATGAFNVTNEAVVTLSGEDPCCGPATIEIGRQGGIGSLNVSSDGDFIIDPTTDFGQIRVGDVGGNGIGSVNVIGTGSTVQILKPNGSICLGCQAPAFGSLAVFDGAVVTVDGAGGWVVVGEADGAIGIVQVDGATSELDAADRLCVGLGSDCETEGGSGKVVVSNGGTVRAFTIAIGNNSEVIAEATGGNLIVGGATVKVNAGTLRAVGNLMIDGPLEIGPDGVLLIEASPSGVGSVNITGDLTFNGGGVVIELIDGATLDSVNLSNVIQVAGASGGSSNIVIRTGDGMEVAALNNVPPNDVNDVLDTLSNSVTGEKVVLCHINGNGKQKTLTVNLTSAGDHFAHGDSLGVCP